MRILIAEDNFPLRSALARLLELRGYQVEQVENGQEAIDLAIKFSPDIILMDISMPVMSGLDCLVALRARSGMAACKIIAMTAHRSEKAKKECIEAGFDGYIGKPFTIDDLINYIQ